MAGFVSSESSVGVACRGLSSLPTSEKKEPSGKVALRVSPSSSADENIYFIISERENCSDGSSETTVLGLFSRSPVSSEGRASRRLQVLRLCGPAPSPHEGSWANGDGFIKGAPGKHRYCSLGNFQRSSGRFLYFCKVCEVPAAGLVFF